MCEDTGKWVKGRDPEPRLEIVEKEEEEDAMEVDDNTNQWEQQQPVTNNNNNNNNHQQTIFWKQYYCDNPIVPLDYSTLSNALAAVSMRTLVSGWESNTTLVLHTLPSRDIRILLQPGFYELTNRLMVDVAADFCFTVETLGSCSGNGNGSAGDLSSRQSHCGSQESDGIEDEDGGDSLSSSSSISSMLHAGNSRMTPGSSSSRRRTPTIRDRLSCRSATSSKNAIRRSASKRMRPTPKHATLILKSRKKNEPIFHIRQGTLHISKLVLLHFCAGVDIWDGNAAIQIQPRIENDRPTRVQSPHKPPTAIITQSDISSLSGRGIVAIDGGYTTIRTSCIHNCAATGIYIGGPGSGATVERTDVVYNGNGNARSRRGIARGHSGVYLEQGVAVMTDCNVSNNALTGCSAVSRDNAFLTITDSDIMGNGTLQLEMPPNGTESRSRSVWRNNHMATLGNGRFRSGFVVPPATTVDGEGGDIVVGGGGTDESITSLASAAF